MVPGEPLPPPVAGRIDLAHRVEAGGQAGRDPPKTGSKKGDGSLGPGWVG
jgi:hypothetical protein